MRNLLSMRVFLARFRRPPTCRIKVTNWKVNKLYIVGCWIKVTNWKVNKLYIVGCWGVVQLGGFVLGFSLVGFARVKAHKSVLFTESFLVVWNKKHLVDFVVTLQLHYLLTKGLFIRQSPYRKDTSPNTGDLQYSRVSMNEIDGLSEQDL